MAKQLAQNFSVDLSQIVSGAITAVRGVRRLNQAKKESDFQHQVADGLSYDKQIELRQKWLDDEKGSSFPDDAYISTLEKSLSQTKQLNRFDKYRTKHALALQELAAGKINEEKYKAQIVDLLDGVTDPDLRMEIQNDIVDATQKAKTYNDAIISNKATMAQKDGTVKVLTSAIQDVKEARATAALNDSQDEVAAYDDTLNALNSKLNTTQVENAITDFQVKSATLGVSPVEKLDFFNNQIKSADANDPFRIDGKTYDNAQAYWSQQRDQYLAGQSETLGGNFFEEINSFTDGQISQDNAKFGYTTKQALDNVMNQYAQLSGRPELAPFVVNLDNAKNSSMNGVVLPSPGTTPTPVVLPRTQGGEVVTPPAASTPATPTPTEAPATPPPPTVAAPAQPASTTIGEPGSPQFTPSSGLGTKSSDGKFIYTDQGWKPVPAGAEGSPQAPQYSPMSGDGTLSPDGKFIYRKDKGWEPVDDHAPLGSVSIPQAAPVPIPAATPVSIPAAAPVSIPAVAPLAAGTPPNYSPATGVGTVSDDKKFKFTAKGWEPVLAPIQSPATVNLANPLTALQNFFGKKTAPTSTPSATPTPTPPPVTIAPSAVHTPINEYVVAEGDTLGAISKRSGKTVAQIAADNSIVDVNKIKVGQKLKL